MFGVLMEWGVLFDYENWVVLEFGFILVIVLDISLVERDGVFGCNLFNLKELYSFMILVEIDEVGGGDFVEMCEEIFECVLEIYGGDLIFIICWKEVFFDFLYNLEVCGVFLR